MQASGRCITTVWNSFEAKNAILLPSSFCARKFMGKREKNNSSVKGFHNKNGENKRQIIKEECEMPGHLFKSLAVSGVWTEVFMVSAPMQSM